MARRSIRKNYIYNLIYEVYLIIIPVLVTPYVARVLGENGSGQFSFTYSIAHIFTLFAALGFNKYAQRLIAQHQDNKAQQSIDFWDVFFARLIPALTTLALYFSIVFFDAYDAKYKVLMIIQSLNIIAVITDVSFFFQGNEEFGKLVFRNVAIKTLCIICIFLFVHKESDLWIYTLIQAGTHLLSYTVLWIYIPNYIEKPDFSNLHPLKHLPATLVLFLPTIATSVYTTLDKTLLGLITHIDSENGNYDYAEKLIKVSMTLITSLGTVLIPRNSKLVATGDLDGVVRNVKKASRFVFFLGIPLALGWIAISNNFVPWFLGTNYDKAAGLIRILSPLIVIIGFSNVFGIQFLIPIKRDKEYSLAISFGAAVNLILNIPLIYFFQSFGAAIATVIAEGTVTSLMLFKSRDYIQPSEIIKLSRNYIIAGIIMFFPCFILGTILPAKFISSVCIILIGVITYVTTLALVKDIFLREIYGIVINKIKKCN